MTDQATAWAEARLTFSHREPTAPPFAPGLHRLDSSILQVPDVPASEAWPMLVLFHGATSNPEQVMMMTLEEAEFRGLLVLATKSAGPSWDVLEDGGFGADVGALDAALDQVADRMPLDPVRLAVGGFSDGASYALSLGLANGDLFHHVLAFSPGFAAAPERRGRPRFFVSHGTRDKILPINTCGRRLVMALRHAQYEVDYEEFEGGHKAPPELVAAALDGMGTIRSR